MSKPAQGSERGPSEPAERQLSLPGWASVVVAEHEPVLRVEAGGEHSPYRVVDEQRGPVAEANEFLSALAARGLSPNTVRAYAFDLAALYRWLLVSGKALEQLQHAELLDFVREQRRRGGAPRTINRRLTSCRLLYRFWTDKELPVGRGASLPAPHYRGPGKDRRLGLHQLPRRRRVKLRVQVPRTLVEPLQREQVGVVLRSFRRYRDLALVQLMLLCGLRGAEVLGLTLSDVSFEERRVWVPGKGGKERVLPLPQTLVQTLHGYLRLERPRCCCCPELLVVLQGQRRGKPMTRAGLRSLFRHRRLNPAIANANPHRFRHTFGADMARAGVRLAVLQKMMGHDDPAITLQYINLSMADIAAEFERAMAEIERRYQDR
jgi:site-specific recombinase XerD